MRSESPQEKDAPAWSERTRTCEDAEKHGGKIHTTVQRSLMLTKAACIRSKMLLNIITIESNCFLFNLFKNVI